MKKSCISILLALMLWLVSFSYAQSDFDDSAEYTWDSIDFADLVWEEWDDPLGDDPLGDDPFGDDPFGDDPFGDDPFGDDWLDLLWWGYTETDMVSVSETWEDFVLIESPVVMDNNWMNILTYKFFYSDKSISDPSYADALISQEEFVFDESELTWDTVSLRVEWLEVWKQFYWVVIPVNSESMEGEASTEIPFMLQPEEDEAMHWAAAYELENVSYSLNWTDATLTWTPVDWVDNVEIYFRSESQEDFVKQWTASMGDGSFTLSVMESWNYVAKLIPTDDNWNPVGNDKLLTMKVEVTDAETPEVKEVPQVWPATNAIIAFLILSVIAYFGLRFRKSN